jgi:hypothetical protein
MAKAELRIKSLREVVFFIIWLVSYSKIYILLRESFSQLFLKKKTLNI